MWNVNRIQWCWWNIANKVQKYYLFTRITFYIGFRSNINKGSLICVMYVNDIYVSYTVVTFIDRRIGISNDSIKQSTDKIKMCLSCTRPHWRANVTHFSGDMRTDCREWCKSKYDTLTAMMLHGYICMRVGIEIIRKNTDKYIKMHTANERTFHAIVLRNYLFIILFIQVGTSYADIAWRL